MAKVLFPLQKFAGFHVGTAEEREMERPQWHNFELQLYKG
jgi:hypothetical protein